MFSMLKRMSILRSEEYDFEKVIGRLDELMEHEGVMKAGRLSVRQRGFRGDPMSRVPLLKKPLLLPDGISNFQQLDRSYDDLDARVCRNTIEPRELEELERFAANLGVVTMGYTKVDPDNIFIDRGILFDRAIVISLEMPSTIFLVWSSGRSGLSMNIPSYNFNLHSSFYPSNPWQRYDILPQPRIPDNLESPGTIPGFE